MVFYLEALLDRGKGNESKQVYLKQNRQFICYTFRIISLKCIINV